MAGRFSLGKRWWLWAGVPLVLALLLLAMEQFAPQSEDNSMTEMEARLSDTLSAIEGAGRVRAMILSEQAVSAFSGGSDAGGNVRSVIIVAQGAYDLGVRLELQRAAMTLFSLEANQVEVFSGWEDDAG